MIQSGTEPETATAPVVEVRYCGPRESQFACSVPRCTFRTTGTLQSLKRHFTQAHKLAWGGLSATCAKCNKLVPSEGSLKPVSEHFRVCTAAHIMTSAIATRLKYVCPICQVRWPSITATRSHYYQMHHCAPTLDDKDFGASTPTPKRQFRKKNDLRFEFTYTGSAGPYFCPMSRCERSNNGYSQFNNLKAHLTNFHYIEHLSFDVRCGKCECVVAYRPDSMKPSATHYLHCKAVAPQAVSSRTNKPVRPPSPKLALSVSDKIPSLTFHNSSLSSTESPLNLSKISSSLSSSLSFSSGSFTSLTNSSTRTYAEAVRSPIFKPKDPLPTLAFFPSPNTVKLAESADLTTPPNNSLAQQAKTTAAACSSPSLAEWLNPTPETAPRLCHNSPI